MDPITALAISETVQGVTSAVRSLTEPSDTENQENQNGFDTLLRGMLTPDSANSVNEEELFAALIGQRLSAHAGDAAAEAYQKNLEERKAALTRADGYVNVEQAANEALNALAANGTVSDEIATKVKSESFAAAQLDDNKTALYDGRGGADDPTIAVMNMEAALIQAQQIIQRIENGEAPVPETPTETADSPTTTGPSTDSEVVSADGVVDGPGGFLLKPESEHAKKMVILLDSALAGQVQEVLLKDENGNEVERGVSSGYANPDTDGEREHFRFAKAGSEYPANLTIQIRLTDGSVQEYLIADPGQRND